MSRKFRQFSLQALFLFMTIACIGTRCISRIVDLHQKAVAEHRQSKYFLGLVQRFPPDDRDHRVYCGLRAYYHEAVAAEYDWAVYHPWVSISEHRAHVAPPAVLRMMKAFPA